MQAAARYGAAIEVLEAWLNGLPVEQALTRWSRGARYAGSKDRAAVRDHVFDVLRLKGTCEAMGGLSGRGLILGLARAQGLDVEDIFSGVGHAPSALNAEELAVPVPTVDSSRDVPEWTLPLFETRGAMPDLLASFTRRAPLWVRVNLRRQSREEVAVVLAAEGIETRPHAEVATALEVMTNPRRLRQSEAYQEGLVEPQDLSVQWAVQRILWPGDGQLLDYCAGGGGKALAIADRTTAQIYAHDALAQRMVDLGPRAARAGVQVTTLTPEEVTSRAPFDLVLTDVPCSGSGTWRRDPEAKWRLTPQALDDLVEAQIKILDQAAEVVGKNGRLVYMTCSLFEAENEAQITAFLTRNPAWQEEASWLDTPLTASDGFFTAVLSRGDRTSALGK